MAERFSLNLKMKTMVETISKSRVFGALIACSLLSITTVAQECDELEGDSQTVCLTLMVCMSLDEEKAREQCLQVARQLLDKRDSEAAKAEVEEPEVVQEASSPSVVQEPVVEDEDPEPQIEVEATSKAQATAEDSNLTLLEKLKEADAESSRKRRWFGWLPGRRSQSKSEKETVEEYVTVDGLPNRFAATVLSTTQVGYNDALVVLSNGYVFTVTRARQARIQDDDVVIVVKKEGLSGRKAFMIYGRGASTDATRVLCEHVNPSRQTRRRCDYAKSQLQKSQGV